MIGILILVFHLKNWKHDWHIDPVGKSGLGLKWPGSDVGHFAIHGPNADEDGIYVAAVEKLSIQSNLLREKRAVCRSGDENRANQN